MKYTFICYLSLEYNFEYISRKAYIKQHKFFQYQALDLQFVLQLMNVQLNLFFFEMRDFQ